MVHEREHRPAGTRKLALNLVLRRLGPAITPKSPLARPSPDKLTREPDRRFKCLPFGQGYRQFGSTRASEETSASAYLVGDRPRQTSPMRKKVADSRMLDSWHRQTSRVPAQTSSTPGVGRGKTASHLAILWRSRAHFPSIARAPSGFAPELAESSDTAPAFPTTATVRQGSSVTRDCQCTVRTSIQSHNSTRDRETSVSFREPSFRR